MRLTPADVHNVAFKKPSIGKRGYDEDEVDAFLDIVEAELTQLIEENNELRQQAGGGQPIPVAEPAAVPVDDGDAQGQIGRLTGDNEQLRQQLAQAQSDLAEQTAAAQAAAQQAQAAQQHAEQAPTSAPEPAQEVVQPAAPAAIGHHVQAARVLELAQQTADQVTDEANTEANRVVTEARQSSESIVAEANAQADAAVRDSQIKAEAIDRESQRKYSEVMSQLTAQRTSLENKIDSLRTYEREYRTRLKGWITDQLQQLDSTGTEAAEAADE